jgi:hypothetical protein
MKSSVASRSLLFTIRAGVLIFVFHISRLRLVALVSAAGKSARKYEVPNQRN